MARSRGAPARLICLVLLALVASVCLFATGAEARRRRRGPPQPCPNSTTNATVACEGCIKRSCRFDDRCHWANNLQTRVTPCVNVANPENPAVSEGQLKTRNQCLAIQRKHGARAAPIAGGPGNRRVRCQAATVKQPGGKTAQCICTTRRGNPAKRGCRNCIPNTELKPCNGPCGSVNPPPPPSPPSPPPAPPSPPSPPPNNTCVIPGCDMVTQWGNYKPSVEGTEASTTWFKMCNFAPQAKSISYAMGLNPKGFALAKSVWDGTTGPSGVEGGYGGASLNQPDFTGNTYFDNAAIYAGAGTADKKFLNTFFNSGVLGAGTGGVGTDDPAGRAEVLKKTSQDWAPVVWIMKYLDEAASKLAAGGSINQAAAKLAFDYVAGAYLGCGQNNPIALPTTPNVTYAGKTFTTGGPTLYTPAGTTQKRSSNTGQQETFNGNTNIASKAVLVVKTLNEGPTLNGINVIKDSLLTVYSQATLRYSAKLTLDAHLPGNGMGGSTKPVAIDSPSISTSGVTACGVNQVSVAVTSCAGGKCSAQAVGAPKSESDFDKPLCCNVAANMPADLGTARPSILNVGSNKARAGMGYVEWNQVGAVSEAQAGSVNTKGVAPLASGPAGKLNRKTQGSNAGFTYPKAEQLTQSSSGVVTFPVSGCTNLRANALGVGNSLAMVDISQFPVAEAANAASGSLCKAGYEDPVATGTQQGTVSGQRNGDGFAAATVTTVANPNAAGSGAVTVTLGTGRATKAYCTGPSVGYLTPYYIGTNWVSEAATGTTQGTSTVVTTVGKPGAAAGGAATVLNNGAALGSTGGAYEYLTLGTATGADSVVPNYAATLTSSLATGGSPGGVESQGLNPNTLAMNKKLTWVSAATNGQYSGARQNFAYIAAEIDIKATYLPFNTGDTADAAAKNTDGSTAKPFLPARLSPDEMQYAPARAGGSGKNMGGEDSFACSDGGSDTGADTAISGKTGNKAIVNGSGGAIKNQLEGLAFWKIIAGQMNAAKPANVPKDSSGNELTLSKVHENCAANIEAMLTFNTGAVVKNANSATAVSQTSVKGNQPNAISFPTWKVAIGSKPTGQDFNYYVVPNGFCYVNQCLVTYLNSVTQDKGAGFGKLIKEPNMGAPTAGKNCGQANGACGSIALFRQDNLSPLSYTCSKLGGPTANTVPDTCGTTRWKPAPFTETDGKQLIYWAGSNYDVPAWGPKAGTANGFFGLGSDPDGAQYITKTASVSSWNGQEWPAPSQTASDQGGRFVGAPVV